MEQHVIDFSPTGFWVRLTCECQLSISKRGIIGSTTLSFYLSLYLFIYHGASSRLTFHRLTVNLKYVVRYNMQKSVVGTLLMCWRDYPQLSIKALSCPLFDSTVMWQFLKQTKTSSHMCASYLPPQAYWSFAAKVYLTVICGHIRNISKILPPTPTF